MRTMRLSVRLSNSKMNVKHGAAFIHFTSIDSVIRAKACLSADPRYLVLQVRFGKDRCATFGMIRMKACTGLPVAIIESVLEDDVLQDVLTVGGRRNVYLGNISPDTTTKKICNVISGGMLSHIHHQPPSTLANVAFVDPDAAITNGAKIMERQVEVHWNDGWPHTISPDMNHALRRGATGELFVNNVPRLRGMSTDRLLHDFSMFGTVEKVRWYWHWTFAFVNFSNIASATAAIQGIKEAKPGYELNKCRVDCAFQDRCAPFDPKYEHEHSQG